MLTKCRISLNLKIKYSKLNYSNILINFVIANNILFMGRLIIVAVFFILNILDFVYSIIIN